MTATPVARADRGWLELREPLDAQSRSVDLVRHLTGLLPSGSPIRVHDLGSGTGAMRRWLAPQLSGPQTWVEHDRDVELLNRDRFEGRTLSRDGHPVTVETRASELEAIVDLEGASLITASALLDVLTRDSLQNLTRLIASSGAPCLLTLSVDGRVDLQPADPDDARIQQAFNDHQRRATAIGTLLGPDAAAMAADLLEVQGMAVRVAPSPWRLGPACRDLLEAWLDGWIGAASEQDTAAAAASGSYVERRMAHARAGRLNAVVHHVDLLAWPS